MESLTNAVFWFRCSNLKHWDQKGVLINSILNISASPSLGKIIPISSCKIWLKAHFLMGSLSRATLPYFHLPSTLNIFS